MTVIYIQLIITFNNLHITTSGISPVAKSAYRKYSKFASHVLALVTINLHILPKYVNMSSE